MLASLARARAVSEPTPLSLRGKGELRVNVADVAMGGEVVAGSDGVG